jgi:hypothetical protein
MPERSGVPRNPYDFAVVRIVPRVEREEFVNAGVVVFCPAQKFLGARVRVDEPRLRALWPEVDIPLLRQHLEPLPAICAGDPDAGPIAARPLRERFHWVVAPRSTMIQISAVHTGLCESPEAVLGELFAKLVATAPETPGARQS